MRYRVPRRRARGQALVETVLGLLVFLTVFMFGIYFAEVGALALKVSEAANFAVWDATGRGAQGANATRDWERYGPAVAAARNAAQGRYQDFDSLTANGAGAPLQQVYARATPIQVQCEQTSIEGIGPEDSGDGTGPAPLAVAMPGMNASFGISCAASSVMRAVRIPGNFHDGKWGFRTAHNSDIPMQMCSSTQGAAGGGCVGRLAVLLDDWGLATREEGRSCPLAIDASGECANTRYYRWVRDTFEAQGGMSGAGSALAAIVGGTPPGGNEGQFFMSFQGSERGFIEKPGMSHVGSETDWETTPHVKVGDVTGLPYRKVLGQRGSHWLGKQH